MSLFIETLKVFKSELEAFQSNLTRLDKIVIDPDNKWVKDVPTKGACIYVISLNDEIKYVGKAVNPRERLKQHLITCPKGTSSCFNKVQNEKKKNINCEFSIRVVSVPQELYSSIEEGLVLLLKTDWNDRTG